MGSTSALAAFHNPYSRILSKFPSEHLTYCFAYGSGVLKQINNENKRNMIDFILAVDNAEEWHQCNLRMNPGHYSYLSLFGSRALAKVQTNIPSRVYFNSMIPIKDENVVIKYGVITQNDLIADLLDWNDLYVAGRLHKPVKVVQKPNSEDLTAALQLNLQSAVHASLLLLPENFSEIQFYKAVTSLSYIGDFRMKFGEDKNKVDNIVSGGLQKFRSLYASTLKMMEDYVEMPTANGLLIEGERSCRQDISPTAKHFHLNHLPRTPQRQLVRFWNKGSRNRQDTEDVLRALAFDPDCGEVVQSTVKISGRENMEESNEKSVSGVQSMECDATHFFGPSLPPHFFKKSEDKKIYSPSVATNLRKKDESVIPSSEGKDKVFIGPDLPEYLKSTATIVEVEDETSAATEDDCFGPSTTLMASGDVTGYYTCMKAQNKNKKSATEPSIERETWMTQLPEKRIASLGLLPRHFKSRIQTEKERDSSVWTDTPADKKRKERNNKNDYNEILKTKRLQERDREMEKLAKKMAKKLRKKESLLEIHQKNMKKKQKVKQSKEVEALPERRPFDRNIDLQVPKLDYHQKRTILNKSQLLNNRFAPGESKFL